MTILIIAALITIDIVYVGLISRLLFRNGKVPEKGVLVSTMVGNVFGRTEVFKRYIFGPPCKVVIDKDYWYFGVTIFSYHFKLPRDSLIDFKIKKLFRTKVTLCFKEGDITIIGLNRQMKEVVRFIKSISVVTDFG